MKPFFDLEPISKDAEEGYTDKLKCLFNEFLPDFLKEISSTFCVHALTPVLGNGQSVDVFNLYLIVRQKGGYEKVTEKRLWGSVAAECGFHAIFGSTLKLIHAKYLSALNAYLQKIDESKGSKGSINTIDLELRLKRFLSEAVVDKKNRGAYVKLGSKMPGLDLGSDLRFSDIDEQNDSVRFNGEMDHGNANSISKDALYGEGIRNVNIDNSELLISNGKIDGDGDPESVCKNAQNAKGFVDVDDDKASGIDAFEKDIITIEDEVLDSLAVSTIATASDLKRKRECASGILYWINMVAKDPCDPLIGTLPESSKWKFYTSSHIWKQILLVRQTFMLKKNADSNDQQLNWLKKQKMHPIMYDDHNISPKLRYSQRILNAKECSKRNFLEPSSSITQINNDPELNSIVNVPHQSEVLIGPHFQADVSDWSGKNPYEADPKWLGTRIWPSIKTKNFIEREPLGKGRQNSCGCSVPDSIDCVKFHVSEKRNRLRLELGIVYYQWGFDFMGENAAILWTNGEEKMFYDTVKSNPFYLGCFWDKIRKSLPNKGMKSLVNYYFNVFNLRRRGDQNRSTPDDINSDEDDEPDDGSETVIRPGSIFCSPKKSKPKLK